MKLEDMVCLLELSIKLKELGIKQRSIFVWEYYSDECHGLKYLPYSIVPNDFNGVKLYSAFNAAELGNILPNRVTTKEGDPFNTFRIAITKCISVENNMAINNFMINYECDFTSITGEEAWFRRKLTSNIYDPNLANTLAKMLIYLLENNLLKNNTKDETSC